MSTRPAAVPFDIEEDDDSLTIVSDRLRIRADKATGALTFMDADGDVYVREREQNHAEIRRTTISDAPTYEVSNTFTLKPDESWYGFGYIDSSPATINRRGQELLLIQTNLGIVIPMILSSERYGIMWDTYSVMRFRDNAEGATLWAESAPGGVDYYFMAGEDLDEVIVSYRKLTGHAPMYPKQALGLFMSKERYPNQWRIVEVARRFREEGFPLDYIVQDWQYWGSDRDGTWSGMIWNEERYPDPEGMIQAIHDLNMKLMISIWPSVGNDTPLAHELDEYGLRFEPLHWISRQARIYDAFSTKGREIYFKHIRTGLLDKGVDALWMDGTEVEVGTACWNPQEVARDIKGLGRNAMGDFSRYLNPYTLMTTKGTYEGQRAINNKRVFTLTLLGMTVRSVTPQPRGRATLRRLGYVPSQMAGGLNVTMWAKPVVEAGHGGFFVSSYPGGEQNPAFRELFNALVPVRRVQPDLPRARTNIEREPYIFRRWIRRFTTRCRRDASALPAAALHLSQRGRVTSEHYTLMRALPFDFVDDAKARDISDAFMFGPALLVHPVTRPIFRGEMPPPDTVPAANLRTPDGEPGIVVQYYEGRNFDVPKERLVVEQVDETWPGPPLAELPAGLTSVNNFSARWEGMIVASEDGEHEIGLEGDDGFRVFVDGKLIAEDWSESAARYKGGRVTLRAGEPVSLKIEFYQGGGERMARLAWRTPSELRELEQEGRLIDATVETYLPAGTDWYDFWTGEKFEGGQTVARECPLDEFPLYVRAGSIVPMGPIVQYATEQPEAPYEIRIYPGADGSFTIYEDDNETYAYEQGEYATYDLAWDDAARTLTIGARNGSFPGMVEKRQLNVVLVAPGVNSGIAAGETNVKSVEYTGEAIQVSFAD